MEPAIETNSLRKSYKDVSVLKDVTLSVETGTVFALLGSNGAGKTTTINILTTLIKADGGTAKVAGYDVSGQGDKVRTEISLTGQFAAVDDRLTGRENLRLIGDLRHVADPAKTATDLLHRFGLDDAADRSVSTFSGGMRRRLDIAMSLIGSPSVIFLDEPTTGFDPEGRNEMWRTIHTLLKAGRPCSSRRSTSTRPTSWPTTSRSCIKEGSSRRGQPRELKRLVPGGLIELTFQDEAKRESATEVLGADYSTAPKARARRSGSQPTARSQRWPRSSSDFGMPRSSRPSSPRRWPRSTTYS